MIPYGFGQYQKQSDHHWMLACVAVLLSVVVHLVLMFFFSDWAIGGVAHLREKGREWFGGERVPPMRVETMQADPMRIGDKVAGERDTPSRGPIEVSERVESLSQAASPALTAPPPIPREALAPGIPVLKETMAEQVDTTPWMPRQEIAQIFDRTVQDQVAALPRREIPLIERVPNAPDIVPSIDLAGRRFGKDPEPPKPMESAEVFDTQISKGTYKVPVAEAPDTASKLSAGATEARFALQPGEKSGGQQEQVQKQMEEASKQVAESVLSEEERRAREAQAQIAAMQGTVDYQPIDDLLAVGIETYSDPKEPGRLYFRIGIQPRADKDIPVIAKDVVFVQDVSASMSEERMVFCRRALAAALQTLNPDDRFNVVAFRDTYENCFEGWVPVNEGTLKTATEFVGRMRAFGQTDVFGSLRSLMKLPRDPNRPMIAMIVTDGKPTFGVTESAPIISDFSKLNNGMIAVYMYGTQRSANAYLLDMLTYCNRGASTVLNGNRWDIPPTMATVYEGFRSPVMSDITVVFDSASQSEVYPKSTANLYKDRALELSGVCPDTTVELILQVRGLAAGKGYDSIIRLNLAEQAKAGTAGVKARWAHQKMYHLVGTYSREAHQQVMAEMLKVNALYGVPIPYKSELK